MVASIPNDIFQFSTYSALQAGFNVGQPRTTDLTSHGTHGIGVFEDGQPMLLENSRAYVFDPDGKVTRASAQGCLPFAMVTVFQPTRSADVSTSSSLIETISSPESGSGNNTLSPFVLEGSFSYIELTGSTSTGQTQIHHNVSGSIFGYLVPTWMQNISGPRMHCHFIGHAVDSETYRFGGKVVSFEAVKGIEVLFAKCGRFHLGFPQGSEWEELALV